MIRLALKNWWILTAKGILTLAFGITALSTTTVGVSILAKFFSVFILISGLTLVIISILPRKTADKSWKLTEGFIDIVIGTVILSFTGITTDIFISIVAIWISFMGILQVSNSYRLKSLYHHWWLLVFNAIMAIVFAILIFTHPIHGVLTKTVLIGLQGIVFGSFVIISSIYIRKLLSDISIDIPHKEGDEGNQELTYY